MSYSIFYKVLSEAFRIWSTPVIRLDFGPFGSYVEAGIKDSKNKESIDKRIAHLETAKNSLNSALKAVDDLKLEADTNKKQLEVLQNQIHKAKEDKEATVKDLSELKKLKAIDVSVFKNIAGSPSRKQVAIERLIGFGIGILASLVAAWIWSVIK